MGRLAVSAVIAGLGLGSMYALVAIGYTLILGASGVFNFAQGAAVAAGALVSFGLGTELHLPVLVVIAVVLLTGGVTGMLTHTLAVLPLTFRRSASSLTYGTFLSTLGLGLVFNSIIALAFGIDTYPVHYYVSSSPWTVFGYRIPPIYLVMLLAVAVLGALLELVSRRTKAGLVMRATFSDPEGAALAGVSITSVIRRAFVVGCALAAVAGFFVAPLTDASASIADQFAFYGFAAMAIGGFGSLSGAITGGLIVGLVGEVPLLWLPPTSSTALVYGTLVFVLLVRPQGLFGSGGTAFGASALREV